MQGANLVYIVYTSRLYYSLIGLFELYNPICIFHHVDRATYVIQLITTLHQSTFNTMVSTLVKNHVMHTIGPRGHRSERGGAPGASLHVSSGKTNGNSERETKMGRWKACQGDHRETGVYSSVKYCSFFLALR